jgi:phage-related protein
MTLHIIWSAWQSRSAMIRTKQEHYSSIAVIPKLGYPHASPSSLGRKAARLVGSSKRDFVAFPSPVQREIGNALGLAQFGGKHPNAKPWKGEGPGVFEVVDDFDGDTYRAVYTVRFRHVVYVLHAFQKKSPRGKRTARTDIELIARRQRIARQDYEARHGKSER